MKSFTTIAVLGFLGLLATSNPLSGQFVFLGGGATIPVSDYGEYADTGFLVTGGAGFPVGETALVIGAEGFYGQNSHSDIDGDKTSPYGVMGMLQYDFAGPNAESSLYVLGEAGILWHKFSSDLFEESTDSGLGLGGAAGYYFPLGGISGFVEGRVMHASIDDSNTTFVGAIAGISIPLGQ